MKRILLLILLALIQLACKNRKVALVKQSEASNASETQKSTVSKGSATEAATERNLKGTIADSLASESHEVLEFDGGTISYNATTGETNINTKGRTKLSRSTKSSGTKKVTFTDSSSQRLKANAKSDSTGQKQQQSSSKKDLKDKRTQATPNPYIIIGIILGLGVIVWQLTRK